MTGEVYIIVEYYIAWTFDNKMKTCWFLDHIDYTTQNLHLSRPGYIDTTNETAASSLPVFVCV